MSRYIDADKLLDALYEHEFTILCPLDEVSNVIDAEPTADVVEAPVRCRDCEHVQIFEPHFVATHTYGCERLRIMMPPDGFCSYGERKVQECD